MTDSGPHTTVLLKASVEALNLNDGDVAIDCTVGGGGHTEAMLTAVGKSGRVIGLDRDETAFGLARTRLAADTASGRLHLVKAPFSQLGAVVASLSLQGKVQGILADIGVSSMHLDQAERGFSFMKDGPLDMRMDQSGGRTAADLVADLGEDELTRIFRDFGEEPKAKQIARKIVQVRGESPITRTSDLADLVKRTVHYPGPSRKHPATRVFQALRLAVNDELGELERLIDQGVEALRFKGRLAIISFHSLEDRIVKTRFIALTGRKERANVPRDLPFTAKEMDLMHVGKASVIKPFPLSPTDDEINSNPRARSAKLRVLEKS